MKITFNIIIVILGICFLNSCGSAKTIVERPVVIPCHVVTNQVQIFRDQDTVTVPEYVKTAFENALCKKLYSDNLVQNAPGIQLRYHFIQFNDGSRLARYLTGGIGNAGEASLMVEVIYVDPEGLELGRIRTEGKISSGFFGGSSNNAVDKAAEEVAYYTRGVVLDR